MYSTESKLSKNNCDFVFKNSLRGAPENVMKN